MTRTVAIIPARGGSKRIPRKNIREFCGKPMIAWSIEVARESGLFDDVIVSTDDDEVRSIALDWGAEVPFKRPPELSNDHATTLPVVRHTVQWLAAHDRHVTRACCIYATAPFLQPSFLRQGFDTLNLHTDVEFVFSATPFAFAIFRALMLDRKNKVSMFWPEHELTRSQDLPAAYHDAGQFYWGTVDAWLTRSHVFSSNSRAVILPSHFVQDIDTPEDWELAELKFKLMLSSRDE